MAAGCIDERHVAARDHDVLVEVITDRKGRYRFAGVPAGRVLLQLLVASSERVPRASPIDPIDVEAGKTYSVELRVPAK